MTIIMKTAYFPHHRHSDPSTVKRRHNHHHIPPPPSADETLFRILCPAAKTGALIGKGGSIIRQIREETGAKIHIGDPIHGCDERVIAIVADVSGDAVVRVFERIVKVGNGDEIAEEGLCRLLLSSNQASFVFGRNLERIEVESGAQVRVFPEVNVPACASSGDELIQITGDASAVKNSLLSLSSCLQENPAFHVQGYVSDVHSRGHFSVPGPDSSGDNRMISEEIVVFKLLCHLDKVRSLIGKGGSVIHALQIKTGASIKIVDTAPGSDEQIVFISAQENSEQNHSPATEAVIHVQSRMAVIGHEPGAAVVARLLVHSQQIGCLLGKGGSVINEMRRVTGASIRLFPKEELPPCGSQNDELIQVIGGLQSVQDALYQITCRLRKSIFSMRPTLKDGGPQYFSPSPEMPRPMIRPRHDPLFRSHYPSPVEIPHGMTQPFNYHPASSHMADHFGQPNVNRVPYSYNETSAFGPACDRPPSPGPWTHQGVSSGNTMGGTNVRSGSKANDTTSATVEIVVPQIYLSYVYGENNSNLNQIMQISGANVFINDPRPGATEGVVVLSGRPDQLHSAQTLVHAFILCGTTPPP